jgi:drug/metabolite transporter (DMT)-like permease
MAACRFLLAGGALYAILRARGVAAPSRVEWRRAALAGALMLVIGNGLVTWAEQRVPSNQAALMIAAVPLFTALLDWWRPGGVRPRAAVLVGIALGAVGMVLLVAGRGAGGRAAEGGTLVGVVALLLSGLGWASGSLYSRYGSMHAHPVMAAAQQMIAGGAGLLGLALVRGEPAALGRASLTPSSLGAFLYLTLFGSLLAFSAFGWLVKVSTPSRLSTTAYVNPMVAVVLGWLVLGETLGAQALVGAAFIVCAVLVMTVRPSSGGWGR